LFQLYPRIQLRVEMDIHPGNCSAIASLLALTRATSQVREGLLPPDPEDLEWDFEAASATNLQQCYAN
jgi:hypothetical protein